MTHEFEQLSNDELTRRIERLVDGEVDQVEFQQIMAALEEHPSRWRECALAFLEDQMLRRSMSSWDLEADDLRSLDPDPNSSSPKVSAASNVPSGSHVSSQAARQDEGSESCKPAGKQGNSLEKTLLDSDAEGKTPLENHGGVTWLTAKQRERTAVRIPADGAESSRTRQPGGTRTVVWVRRFALAASILMAFGIGIVGRTIWQADRTGTADRSTETLPLGQSTAQQGRDQPASTLVRGDQRKPQGTLLLEVGNGMDDQPGAPWQELSVPVYAKDAMPSPASVGLTPDAQDYLRQSQIDLRTSRQLMSVKGPDGQTYLVPIESLEFRSFDRNKYQ